MTIEEKMVEAYGCAMQASHSCGRAAIHVGQAGWDWCLSMANIAGQVPGAGATAWGFPIVLELAWEPDRVVVRVDHEVSA